MFTDNDAAYNYTSHEMYYLFYEFDVMTRHIVNVMSNEFRGPYADAPFQIATFDTLWRGANSAIIDHMLLGVK